MLKQNTLSGTRSVIPPGPQGYPLLGVLPMLLRNPLNFLSTTARQYDDIIAFNVGPKRFYLLTRPEYLKHVFQDNYRVYHKGANLSMFKRLVGNGLGVSEGDAWLRQRRLSQPAFHHQRLARMAEEIVSATAAMLERWQAVAERKGEFDVVVEMKYLTQRIIVATMFGSSISNEADAVYQAFDTALVHLSNSLWLSSLPLWLIPGRRRFEDAVATLDRIVYQIINERRMSGGDGSDLLGMLLQACDADTGERMTDTQVRDEVMTIFLAGYETVASTLAWALHLIAQHPMVAQRLQEEVATVLDQRAPTFQDLPKLTYTRMIADETLRLYPSAWALFRSPVVDDTIGEYHVPAGSVVIISPYVQHRDVRFWSDPERFDPERFDPEQSAKRTPFTYIPFAAGPRQCIGNSFALMEAQLIIAMIAQRFEMQDVPGHVVAPHVALTLQARTGIRMIPQVRRTRM